MNKDNITVEIRKVRAYQTIKSPNEALQVVNKLIKVYQLHDSLLIDILLNYKLANKDEFFIDMVDILTVIDTATKSNRDDIYQKLMMLFNPGKKLITVEGEMQEEDPFQPRPRDEGLYD